MIIDCHCHAGKGDAMTAPWNTDASLEKYLRRARAAGIDKTIVFPLFHLDYAEANAQIAKIVARSGGRLIGFAFVNTQRDAGRIFSMVSHAVRRWVQHRAVVAPGSSARHRSAHRVPGHCRSGSDRRRHRPGSSAAHHQRCNCRNMSCTRVSSRLAIRACRRRRPTSSALRP